jgi:hypothetical protein
MYWFVHKTEHDGSIVPDVEKYAALFFLLKRERVKKKTPFYFAIDGLEFLSDDAVLKIWNLLPIAEPSIKILPSADINVIKRIYSMEIPHRLTTSFRVRRYSHCYIMVS